MQNLQYSPAHRTTFVGEPGALFRGSPSVSVEAGHEMVKREAAAQEEARKAVEAAAPLVGIHAQPVPAVEHAAAAPEVHVDAGAGAANPQIVAHDTSGPDVHVA